jgi:hypothetical protein
MAAAYPRLATTTASYQGEPTIEESHTDSVDERENALYSESQEPLLGFGEENEVWESYNQSQDPYHEDYKPLVNFMSVSYHVQCTRCRETFPSNNKLHKHLRSKCSGDHEKKQVRNSPKVVTAHALAATVIESDMNAKLDVVTGYRFRTYHFVTAEIRFSPDTNETQVCLDTGCSVTLIDRLGLESVLPDIEIRTIATPISVSGSGLNKQMSASYVILPIYFAGTKKGKPAIAKFTREAHLVDDQRAKMLIGTDIILPEKIDIMISSKSAIIGSCGVIIPIRARPQEAPSPC